MAELAKKLNLKKDGVQQTAKAYSTTAEVGEHWVNAKIDGVPAYVAIGDIADSRATSGRVKGSGGDTYAILSSGKLPYNKVEFTGPGVHTIIIPAGCSTIKLTLAGGGGGGGGSPSRDYRGGNGGRGGLNTFTLPVTPGTYPCTVGGGGGGGGYENLTGYGGGAGGSSSAFNRTVSGGGGGSGWKFGNEGNAPDGASYGSGGGGGSGGSRSWGGNGAPGWVIIEYGGDI